MNNTENYIKDFYTSIGVDELKKLNAPYISNALGFILCWDSQNSKAFIDGPVKLMIVDKRLNDQQQLERFYHEIGHYILHHSPTVSLQLYKYFEGKADNIIPYLAMPLHLLEKLDWSSSTLIFDISEKFKVSHEMALKRVEQLKDCYIMKGVDLHEGFGS